MRFEVSVNDVLSMKVTTGGNNVHISFTFDQTHRTNYRF